MALTRMRARLTVVRWLLVVIALAITAHADTVVIDEGFEELNLGKHLELAYDPTGEATIDDVLAGKLQFAPSTKDVPSFGYRKGAEWARFELEDSRGAASPIIIEHGYGQSDVVELFDRRREADTTFTAGDHVSLVRWDLKERFPAFRLEAARTRTVFFRLAGGATHAVALRAYRLASYEVHRRADLAGQSFYFGALLVMVVYNALVGIATRARAYAYYVAFLISYGVFQLAVGGLGYVAIWGEVGRWVDLLCPLAIGWVGTFSTLFAFDLLSVRASLPGTLAAFRVVVLVTAIGPGLAALHGYRSAMFTVFAAAALWALVLLSIGARLAWRGMRAARLFILAWSFFIGGTVIAVLRSAGVLATNGFTMTAQQVGSVVEFLLLSFALADRIKQLQAEATRNAQLAAENARLAQAATEQVLAEQERANAELKRLDKLKDEFLANTSHELRTPLNGVIGLTEAVMNAESSISEVGRQRLDLVLKSGRRLATLVNDILDFSKLQRGEFEVQSARFDLGPVVDEVLATLEPAAAQKSLRLKGSVPANLEVIADAARVRQILTNLVGNALKFTDRGTVKVEAAQLGNRVLVRVVDTGIGIAKEAQERIFVAFEQADGGTARKHGGTGLGLTVTRQLVELHGGTIRVESAERKGSAFTFDLAAAVVDEDADPQSLSLAAWKPDDELPTRAISEAPPADPRSGYARASVTLALRGAAHQGVRVLVADDDPINLEVVRALLEPAGYALVCANNGREAVERLYDSGPFDAVLLDVMMPKMTGVEAAAAMRADYPHGTLPILMLTAKNRPEDVIAGLQAGADDYLAKPVNGAELLARLAAHIEGLRSMRAVERLLSPDLVRLVEGGHAAKLEPGAGVGRTIGVVRVAIDGLPQLAARLDEATLFRRLSDLVSAVVTTFGDAGGIAENLSDDQLSFLVPVLDEATLAAARKAIALVVAKHGDGLRVSVAVHAGHVKVGVLGDERWIAVRAVGEASLLGAELARWGVARGFGVLVTDAVLGKLDVRPPARRIGTVRLGAKGHPATVFELLDRNDARIGLDEYVDALEAGRLAEVCEAVAELREDDALVRLLSDQASRGDREIVFGGA